MGLFWEEKDDALLGKITTYNTNRPKEENHMTISLSTEKTFGKIQHPFLIKNPK